MGATESKSGGRCPECPACPGSATKPGAKRGENCSRNTDCADGLICSQSGVCKALPTNTDKDGKPIEGTPCTPGLKCTYTERNGVREGICNAAGVCLPPIFLPYNDLGKRCLSDSDCLGPAANPFSQILNKPVCVENTCLIKDASGNTQIDEFKKVSYRTNVKQELDKKIYGNKDSNYIIWIILVIIIILILLLFLNQSKK